MLFDSEISWAEQHILQAGQVGAVPEELVGLTQRQAEPRLGGIQIRRVLRQLDGILADVD
ncbi:hypothetical protein [Actinomadura sp. 6N118]|uniref:hypothetical protein n=1 Tax=Actinomadura sp. 6N118 TaxID=3375151 RepID=UPI00379E1AB3